MIRELILKCSDYNGAISMLENTRNPALTSGIVAMIRQNTLPAVGDADSAHERQLAVQKSPARQVLYTNRTLIFNQN
jgi:hypothetical protein